MRISTSKFEAMVLDQKKVVCPPWVGGETLPQVEEFKYLGVLFTGGGRIECEINRWIASARYGEEGAELQGEALCLLVSLCSYPHLWS